MHPDSTSPTHLSPQHRRTKITPAFYWAPRIHDRLVPRRSPVGGLVIIGKRAL